MLLRDIRDEDLASTERLLALYDQAKASRLIDHIQAGRLDFLAMAERARAHGKRPGALFSWLLRGKQTKFSTQADEEAAQRRLRAWRDKAAVGKGVWAMPARGPEPRELSADERFFQLCTQAAKQQRIEDPFYVAFLSKRWTRPQWEAVHASYEAAQQERRDCKVPTCSRDLTLFEVPTMHWTEEATFQIYLLFEAILGVDENDFTEELKQFLLAWQPPAGREWTAKDEERRQMFATMEPAELRATWRALCTEIKRGLY